MIDRAEQEGVERFYLPGIDSHHIDEMLALETNFPGKCMAMMGLHPCYVKENYRDELAIVEEWLSRRSFAAVGEIGLDFYWDTTFVEQQYTAFRLQCEWALKHDRPIVIHSREATREAIEVVKEYKGQGLRGIFHCFGGSLQEANDIIATGFYLGIGGVITYKKSGLAEVLAQVSLDHIVLETDAPYLSPVPFRGRRNESSYLKYILATLSAVKQLPEAEVAAVTTANAEKIFGG